MATPPPQPNAIGAEPALLVVAHRYGRLMGRLITGILFLLVLLWLAESDWTWRALDAASEFLTQLIVDTSGLR